jgi:hypothetical protein
MSDNLNKEHQSVSKQTDNILSYMQDRFHQLMTEDKMDDAISIGDEYIEWMKGDPDEVYLYSKPDELLEDYKSKQQR